MEESYFHQSSVSEVLCAQIIGQNVITHVRACSPDVLAQTVESEAIRLLEEIRRILNDPELEDSTCFMRIDAITSAFLGAGMPVDRHGF